MSMLPIYAATHKAQDHLADLLAAVQPLFDDPEHRAIIVGHHQATSEALQDILLEASRARNCGVTDPAQEWFPGR